MKANRRTDTKPELALRHALHRLGYRYRKDFRLDLDSGRRVRPDIAFTARKVAVFVDGCFWHACPEHGSKPKANEWYWGPKLIKNVERDRVNDAALILAGWTVVRLWEHVPLDEAVTTVVTALTATALAGTATGPADTGPNGQPRTATITLTAFLNAIIDEYLASPDTAVLLPQDLHAFAHGQWATVINKRGFASALSSAPTPLQEITLRCSDTWAAMNPAAIAQQARLSLFTPALAATAAWQQQLCAIWPHDPGVSGIVRSNVPAVFVNGTADPADPPANVAAAPATMPNALLVSIPGGSHDVAATGCIPALSTAFILAGKPANRARWAACARTMGHYYPPFPAAP